MNREDAINGILTAMALGLKLDIGYNRLDYSFHIYQGLCPLAIIYHDTGACMHALKTGCSLPRQFNLSRIMWMEIT